MVRRYPHSGVIEYETEGSYDEANGTYTSGSTVTINLPACRFEYKGKRTLTKEAGNIVTWSYEIFAPLFSDEVRDYGTITYNEKSRSLNIKHVEKYQRHVKIWADD